MSLIGDFDQLGPELFADVHQFSRDRQTSGVKLDALAGVWLIWNLKGTEPSVVEIQEGALVGAALGNIAFQWFEAQWKGQA